jgi:hypothetical protein
MNRKICLGLLVVLLFLFFSTPVFSAPTYHLSVLDEEPELVPTLTPTPKAAYSFLDEGSLDISIEEPNILTIKNDSDYSFEIDIQLTNFSFILKDQQKPTRVHPYNFLAISPLNAVQLPEPIILNKFELERYEITVNENALEKIKPGAYSGYIRIIDVETGEYISKKVLIDIPDGRVTSIEFPQGEWSTLAVCDRLNSLNASCAVEEPYFFITTIEEYDDDFEWVIGKSIGYLHDKKSNLADVQVESVENLDNKYKVNLKIDGIKTYGEFSGNLNMFSTLDLPEDDGTQIDYKVISQHQIKYPIIAFIIAGILVFFLEGWFGKNRKILLLKTRTREVKSRFIDLYKIDKDKGDPGCSRKPAKGETKSGYCHQIRKLLSSENLEKEIFVQTVAGPSLMKGEEVFSTVCQYSLYDDFFENFTKVKQDLNSLGLLPVGKMTVDDQQYAKMVASVEALERSVDYWETFGKKLNTLFEKLAEFHQKMGSAKPKKHGPDWPCKKLNIIYPNFYINGTNLLIKQEDCCAHKINQLPGLINEIELTIDLLNRWHAMEEEIQLYLDRLSDMAKINPKEFVEWQRNYIGKSLFEATKIINQAWGELWLSNDPTELKEKLTKLDIQESQKRLLELYGFYGSLIPRGRKSGVQITSGSFIDFIRSTIETIKELPLINRIIPKIMRRFIRITDLINITLSIVISGCAIYTTQYYQKPFGSINDYLLLATTIIASKTVVSVLMDSIRKMRFSILE